MIGNHADTYEPASPALPAMTAGGPDLTCSCVSDTGLGHVRGVLTTTLSTPPEQIISLIPA